jgi:dUTP pyrophosphatase
MKIKALRDMSEYGVDLQEEVDYRKQNDACIDLVACKPVYLPGSGLNNQIIPSGIAVELPRAYMALILPRSGHAKNHCIQILGGVIDNGYRGEILINLINLGKYPVSFPVGTRIAQLLILPFYQAKLEWVTDLSPTERGEDGHGSTGI